jgi:hypothetical protein
MSDPVERLVAIFFPRAAKGGVFNSEEGRNILTRIEQISDQPLSLTHLNQLLHRNHEAGVTHGFFRYYFLSDSTDHPYPLGYVIDGGVPPLHDTHIVSLAQLEWGLRRFWMDALLYFGNFRSAYRVLRTKSYEELTSTFSQKRFSVGEMQLRGPIMPLEAIPADDRYLISELACKAYADEGAEKDPLILRELVKAFRAAGKSAPVRIKDIVKVASDSNANNFQVQLCLPLGAEEFENDSVASEQELAEKVSAVRTRFRAARVRALANTKTYLSVCNELDVYVATSMRSRDDFRQMATNCKTIFEDPRLRPLYLRYFDPTLSAAECHEDKGLIECLMVNRARCIVYFAQEKESWGKDCEAAMGLTFGKPVIIYCPPTDDGRRRLKLFRDIHPLSRLIDVRTGVAVGAMITDTLDVVIDLLSRLFNNQMQYSLSHDGDGYYRLLERLTSSVVRLCTSDTMLRETFWNYYHGVE